MTKTAFWAGLGIGAAVGMFSGIVAMNNSKTVRDKVSKAQSAIKESIEKRKERRKQKANS